MGRLNDLSQCRYGHRKGCGCTPARGTIRAPSVARMTHTPCCGSVCCLEGGVRSADWAITCSRDVAGEAGQAVAWRGGGDEVAVASCSAARNLSRAPSLKPIASKSASVHWRKRTTESMSSAASVARQCSSPWLTKNSLSRSILLLGLVSQVVLDGLNGCHQVWIAAGPVQGPRQLTAEAAAMTGTAVTFGIEWVPTRRRGSFCKPSNRHNHANKQKRTTGLLGLVVLPPASTCFRPLARGPQAPLPRGLR